MKNIKKSRKGSVEVVSLVILLVIASITAIYVGNSTSNTTITLNDYAQNAISITN